MARAMALMVVCGCAGALPATEIPVKPVLRIFAGGNGMVLDYDAYAGEIDAAWTTGSLPGMTQHGRPAHETRTLHSDVQGRRSIRIVQDFADGATVIRELVVDDSGDIASVRLYDTDAEGSRSGFRLDGEARHLPEPILAMRDEVFGARLARRR